MSNILDVTEIENKPVTFSKNKYTKVVYHINRKDNKTINSQLFRDIYKGFEYLTRVYCLCKIFKSLYAFVFF